MRTSSATRAAILLVGILWLAGPVAALGQNVHDTLCAETRIFGHVSRGDKFDVSITDDLRFRLVPSEVRNPEGWTIQVIGPDPSRDYLMIATPPYRFGNPRYLDTSYGTTAEAALAWSPRTFQFVLNAAAGTASHRMPTRRMAARVAKLVRINERR